MQEANDRQEGWRQRKSGNRDERDLGRQKYRPTVGTTVVPNLAKRGNIAGKPIPLSQILAPPVMEPDSGFTSVRMGEGSPFAFDEGISLSGGVMAFGDLEPGHASLGN